MKTQRFGSCFYFRFQLKTQTLLGPMEGVIIIPQGLVRNTVVRTPYNRN